MNYKRIYDSLIELGRTQVLPTDTYTERHHIIPKCMNGSDDSTNLVRLTARQHYVAHLLLHKIYPENPYLVTACIVMTTQTKLRCGSNNRVYSWLREKHASNQCDIVRNAWAKKRGYIDYDDQSKHCWDLFLIHKNISKVSELTGFRASSRSINYWCDVHNLHDVKKRLLLESRSIMSRNIRNSFTHEQEQRRIDAVKNSNAGWKSQKTGADNPSASRVIIDDIEYGSHVDAANALGIKPHTVRNRLKSKYYPNYRKPNEN